MSDLGGAASLSGTVDDGDALDGTLTTTTLTGHMAEGNTLMATMQPPSMLTGTLLGTTSDSEPGTHTHDDRYYTETQLSTSGGAAVHWDNLTDVPGDIGGEQGPPGADGADGLSAYEIAVANGFVGTESEWLDSLVGAQGEQGIQGPQGIQGEQGPQGVQGEPGPQGDTGAQGIQGETGAQGPQGIQGEYGLSAYEVAVAEGFVGDEAAWLASLVGPQGEQGIQGIQGEQGPQGDPATNIITSVNTQTGDVVLDADDIDDTATTNKFATQAQLDAADSAVQPGDLATVATSGAYSDLSGTPSIPTTFDDLTDGTTNKAYTSTEKTKLATVSANADQTNATTIEAAITGAFTETTLADGDIFSFLKAAAFTNLHKITWANIKAGIHSGGTWTPAQAGVTLTVAVGTYTRIGRLVSGVALLQWPVTADTTVTSITGFPFAASAPGGIGAAWSATIGYTDFGSSNITAVVLGSELRFYSYSLTRITNANLSGKIVRVSFAYDV